MKSAAKIYFEFTEKIQREKARASICYRGKKDVLKRQPADRVKMNCGIRVFLQE